MVFKSEFELILNTSLFDPGQNYESSRLKPLGNKITWCYTHKYSENTNKKRKEKLELIYSEIMDSEFGRKYVSRILIRPGFFAD